MGLYEKFETDTNAEAEGLLFTFNEAGFRCRLSRAGGGNKDFARILNRVSTRLKRAMDTGTLSNSEAEDIMHRAYAEAVVRSWETQVNGEWRSGIETKDGGLIPFNAENVIATFKSLPMVFQIIKDCAESWQAFLTAEREADAKNS